ncbi:MAG: FKBP-type peptidyl-prolyl cis-trans isomerase [Saprospiraceae bacterium]|nr:FKBP-type peptidyl-prolyl cis-trans isomerase [Saprospiraceae bacterium]MCF8249493.1 FKBP-type peptidyl-prolyl cis-trans isomerase [Saprospiraceae bacterium]MCF8280118.1 FKBP-type peptidyl-prolyl cis-trans isomerase [Bacteroidales bacterium]MCF8310711.1 FKBP-type peptidyl-prolyl cis-trans isomerase [Saprospiraceae bacterium]MCF8439458.1 FKBP-type peptidyl-prolyl cis-trans isomerase [Saprospiraceae bacterium]
MKKLKLLVFLVFLGIKCSLAQTGELPSLEDFLQKNSHATQVSTEGLHYLVTQKGNGPVPVSGDYVLLSYRAMLLDSTVFDESEVDNPLVFQVGNHEVIKGLDHGVQLLKKGSTATLFVPATLGYQQYGVQGSVPPDAGLIYEVKLLDVMNFDQYDQYMRALEERERLAYEQHRIAQFQKDLQSIEAYASAHNLIVRRTNSGLSYGLTKLGKGATPKPGGQVKVAYQGFLLDDTVFDQSEKFEFTLGAAKVIEGWEEGLQFFAPGGEGWLLVPSKLAYGPIPVGKVPANSVLVFKIKMLKN